MVVAVAVQVRSGAHCYPSTAVQPSARCFLALVWEYCELAVSVTAVSGDGVAAVDGVTTLAGFA